MTERHRLLILGGTAEAVALAARAVEEPRLEVITSLAGRTRRPSPVAGRLRVGGFGGAAGLTAYLESQGIDLLVDATHPYAAQISANAAAACTQAEVPRLLLCRPAWQAGPGDSWIDAADSAAAADKLSDMGPKRVFLSTGRRELEAFAPLAEHWFLLRMIDPPSAPLPLMRHELVLGRGPFSEAAERALLKRHGIEVLISKNSGGGATVAKLAAARALGLPAVMIARPAAPAGDSAKTPEAALGWILSQIG